MIDFRVPFVLASGSPRRRNLVSQIIEEVTFDVCDAEEYLIPAESATEAVVRLAREKAEHVARRHETALVLGADTVVVLDGAVLGKPVDDEDARHMLARLSGRAHDVYTGLALVHAATSRSVTEPVRTRVHFDVLTEREIAEYVQTGSPLDKAGAYGIQDDSGALFVRGIEGDFFNVVGLPQNRLYRLLADHFNDLVAS